MYINLNNINLCVWPRKVAESMYCFYPAYCPAQPWELPPRIHEKLKGSRGMIGIYYKSEAEALVDYWQVCIKGIKGD